MPKVRIGSVIFTNNPTDGWQGPLRVAEIFGEDDLFPGAYRAYTAEDTMQAHPGIIFVHEVTKVQ